LAGQGRYTTYGGHAKLCNRAVFRSPPTLAVLNPATGVITERLGVCGDAADVFFDARRAQFYVSCGEGAIDVVSFGSGRLERSARVATSRGARTAIFNSQLDRLFVAARSGGLGWHAAIFVLRPSP
jgi:hypothetical protein